MTRPKKEKSVSIKIPVSLYQQIRRDAELNGRTLIGHLRITYGAKA